MSRLSRKRAKKAGLPSESPVYTGDRKGSVTVHVIDYDPERATELEVSSLDACLPFKQAPTTTWINIEGVHDAKLLEKLSECFGLHGLVLEDIMNTDQRPKAEDYGDYVYIVLKMLTHGKSDEIVMEQISIIVGPNFVLSLQEGIEGDVFNGIRDRIRSGKGKIRERGPDYLAYALIDTVVDHYFVIVERFGDRIESLEAELVENPTQETVRTIYQHKRELIFLHNAVWPLREVANTLGKNETPLIRDSTTLYLRDVYDHIIHVLDSIAIYREMLSGMLDLYLSSVSNRLNEVMKVLTIIAVIFMPLTFIVGIYGMNFRNMPELEWRHGYFAVLAALAVIAFGMIVYFRRKKWL